MTAQHPRPYGVEILGSGTALPERRLTNADLETMMETSDEWIVQRTGIRERRVADWASNEKTSTLALGALQAALKDAGMDASELDLILVATMTPDMPTPSVSCIIAAELGCTGIAAFDLNAACSGFVFSISTASAMIQSGMYRTIGLVGADCLTKHIEYSTAGRSSAILFGDAAAAVVLRRNDNDTSTGMIAHALHSDGNGSKILLIPADRNDHPDPESCDDRELNRVYMNGQGVFKFAVKKFPEVIEEALELAGLHADEVDHYICHQANARILEAARKRFGLDESKLRINIDRFGNTVGASCPLVFDELRKEGAIKPGQRVMFIAFGAGLTWGASLWQL
ncbi:MAG: ketoacyl-ACP synthase III [Phycisphaerales bacterium]|nr:ketoacyl-ACP synthase III [Phycisphaerales bacterium]